MSEDLIRAAYSVLLPAFAGLSLSDAVRVALRNGCVSILLGEDREEYLDRRMSHHRIKTESSEDFRSIIEEASALALSPLLVAVDQELGGIQRLHQLVPQTPSIESALELDSQAIEDACFEMAINAREVGVNLFLSPIVDVVTGKNPWLNGRHLGGTPSQVNRIAQAFITGVQRAGVIATAKHFPGHYVCENDPAVALAEVPGTLADLKPGLDVFQKLIDSGVKAVMTGPALFPGIDQTHSASTSAKVISLLRDDFKFAGLIISDDLDAVSILRGRSVPETAVASLIAGAHLLLVSSEAGLDVIVNAIVNAVETGVLKRETLLLAADRVRNTAEHAAVN